jgi:hypothetical protein
MEPADFRRHNDPAAGSVIRPSVWSILVQREVRAAPMVIGEICAKDAPEMRFAEYDDVI